MLYSINVGEKLKLKHNLINYFELALIIIVNIVTTTVNSSFYYIKNDIPNTRTLGSFGVIRFL